MHAISVILYKNSIILGIDFVSKVEVGASTRGGVLGGAESFNFGGGKPVLFLLPYWRLPEVLTINNVPQELFPATIATTRRHQVAAN